MAASSVRFPIAAAAAADDDDRFLATTRPTTPPGLALPSASSMDLSSAAAAAVDDAPATRTRHADYGQHWGEGAARCFSIEGDFLDEDQGVRLMPVPESFICPISLAIMADPVAAVDGSIYDRDYIERWFRQRRQERKPLTSPVTGLELTSTTLMPLAALRTSLEAYLKMRPELLQAPTAGRSFEEAAQVLQKDLLEKQSMQLSVQDELKSLREKNEVSQQALQQSEVSNAGLLEELERARDRLSRATTRIRELEQQLGVSPATSDWDAFDSSAAHVPATSSTSVINPLSISSASSPSSSTARPRGMSGEGALSWPGTTAACAADVSDVGPPPGLGSDADASLSSAEAAAAPSAEASADSEAVKDQKSASKVAKSKDRDNDDRDRRKDVLEREGNGFGGGRSAKASRGGGSAVSTETSVSSAVAKKKAKALGGAEGVPDADEVSAYGSFLKSWRRAVKKCVFPLLQLDGMVVASVLILLACLAFGATRLWSLSEDKGARADPLDGVGASTGAAPSPIGIAATSAVTLSAAGTSARTTMPAITPTVLAATLAATASPGGVAQGKKAVAEPAVRYRAASGSKAPVSSVTSSDGHAASLPEAASLISSQPGIEDAGASSPWSHASSGESPTSGGGSSSSSSTSTRSSVSQEGDLPKPAGKPGQGTGVAGPADVGVTSAPRSSAAMSSVRKRKDRKSKKEPRESFEQGFDDLRAEIRALKKDKKAKVKSSGSPPASLVADSAAIEREVDRLEHGSLEERRHAVFTLWNWAVTNSDLQVAIAEAGAIAPLVELLRDPGADSEVKEATGAVLGTLATNNAGFRVTIAKAGGIAPLIDFLKTGQAGARVVAARALWGLAAQNVENQAAIVEDGAIPPLVKLLSDEVARVRVAAAAALCGLAIDHKENQVVIAKAGAIAPLVRLLREDEAGARVAAAAALRNLAISNAENQEAVVQAGVIKPLVDLLRDDKAGAQEDAAFMLANLAANNANHQMWIAKAGAVAPLVDLLRSAVPEVQEAASLVLRNLAGDNTKNAVAIADAGAIQPLCRLLVQGGPGAAKQAAWALWNLATAESDNLETIARAGAVAPLIRILGADSPEAREGIATTLLKLADAHDNAAASASF